MNLPFLIFQFMIFLALSTTRYNEMGLLTSSRRMNGEVVNLSSTVNSTVAMVTASLPWQTNLQNELIRIGGYISSNYSQGMRLAS